MGERERERAQFLWLELDNIHKWLELLMELKPNLKKVANHFQNQDLKFHEICQSTPYPPSFNYIWNKNKFWCS